MLAYKTAKRLAAEHTTKLVMSIGFLDMESGVFLDTESMEVLDTSSGLWLLPAFGPGFG